MPPAVYQKIIFSRTHILKTPKLASLDTRVVLHDIFSLSVGIPVGARGVDGGEVLQSADLRLALNELQSKAFVGVPGNVAVHDPGTGVVRVEGQGEVSVGGQHGDVTTGRVDSGQAGGGLVVRASAGAQHPKVVAVEMDRVGLGKVGVDDEVHPLVGAQLPDVLLVAPGRVALLDGHDGGVVPLGDEGHIVHGPLDAGTDAKTGLLVVLVGHGADLESKVRHQVRGILIVARVLEIVGGGGGVVGGRAVVANNAQDVVDIVVVRAGLLRNGAHPEVSSRLGSSDNDVVSLAHANADIGSVEGNDGDEIVGNNFHGVVVNGEAEVRVSSRVHETNAVALARLEGGLESRANDSAIVLGPGVCAVDQTVLRLEKGVSDGVMVVGGKSLVVLLKHTVGGPVDAASKARTSAVEWDQSFMKMWPRSSS